MFCHFGPFFSPFFSSYHIWFLKYKVQHLSFWVIFCLFCPLTTRKSNFKIEKNPWRYYHFTHLQHKWQEYDVWFLRYGVWKREFFVILDCFLPFYSPMDPENQNFGKMKKRSEDIIILQMCTRNDSHMMYGSWDMECKR